MCFVILFLTIPLSVNATLDPPVFLLIKAEGTVEYKNHKQNWKRVRRNKFLFDGYSVQTHQNSTCQLIDTKNQKTYDMGEKSTIQISKKRLTTVKGKVSECKKPGHFENYWEKKFTKVQEYTAALRNEIKKCELTIKDLVLSDDFPEIIWENQGSEYLYRLQIHNESYIIDGTESKIVRFTPKRLPPGKYPYIIEVLDEFETPVYRPKKKRTLTWLSEAESQEIISRVHYLDSQLKNSFIIATFLENKGLNVPAMDYYQRYFENNPYENEMRPYLISIYKKLGLKSLRNNEYEKYEQYKTK